MYKKLRAKFKGLGRRRQIISSLCAVLVLGLVSLSILHMMQPPRSTAAYCSVYKQEKARLDQIANPQGAYPSGVFNTSVDDASQIAHSFGELDQVAPNQIEPDVATLQRLYQTIHDNPASAIQASLSGGSIDDSLKAWTLEHCGS